MTTTVHNSGALFMTTTYKRSDHAERQAHFLSLWLEDRDLKAKLSTVAGKESRSANNWFNKYIAPVMAEIIDQKWSRLPSVEQEAALIEARKKIEAKKKRAAEKAQ